MSTPADPTLAVAAYLKAQEPINEAVEGRVFRPELSTKRDVKMPQASIVIRPAGGGGLFGRTRYGFTDSRLDIVCYGSTRLEAENVGRLVALALSELEASRWENVALRWARPGANPASAIDPQTNWPFCLVTTQVMHSIKTLS